MRMLKVVISVLGLALFAPLSVHAAEAQAASPGCRPGKVIQAGAASWYSPSLQGDKEANGKHYRRAGMTAASKTLRLNSFVEVTNRRNHRKVVVKITDRGPFANGRIIDLSEAAAHELGFGTKGVQHITVRSCLKPT